ncbi:MAG: hypothetical protein NTW49_12290 [Bacteroidia bacterium]|nr:hypothetical protein [Bacteroidia bacterium]
MRNKSTNQLQTKQNSNFRVFGAYLIKNIREANSQIKILPMYSIFILRYSGNLGSKQIIHLARGEISESENSIFSVTDN